MSSTCIKKKTGKECEPGNRQTDIGLLHIYKYPCTFYSSFRRVDDSTGIWRPFPIFYLIIGSDQSIQLYFISLQNIIFFSVPTKLFSQNSFWVFNFYFSTFINTFSVFYCFLSSSLEWYLILWKSFGSFSINHIQVICFYCSLIPSIFCSLLLQLEEVGLELSPAFNMFFVFFTAFLTEVYSPCSNKWFQGSFP